MSLFSLDTRAWLAEHRRQNAALIQASSPVEPRTAEIQRPAPVVTQAELICC